MAERVRSAMEQRGIGARELAAKAGVSKSYVTVLFARAKENPDVGMGADDAAKIASALGVDLMWLVTGKGSPEPHSAEDGTSERPVLGSLSNWSALVAAAKRLDSDIPDAIFDRLAITSPMVARDRINAGYVVDLAHVLMRHATE